MHMGPCGLVYVRSTSVTAAFVMIHTLITHAVKLKIRPVVDGGFAVKLHFWPPSTARTLGRILVTAGPGPSQPAQHASHVDKIKAAKV